MVRVDIDCMVTSPNRLVSEHWRSRAHRRARERGLVRKALSGQRVPPAPWTITLTRVASRTLDTDNLSMSFKSYRDECAAWLGVDDRDPRVTWRYEQAVERQPVRHPKPGAPKLRCWARLTIESMAPSAGVVGVCCDAGGLAPAGRL